jgi:hypothetical protein
MAKLIISIQKIEYSRTTISEKAYGVMQDYIYDSVCTIFAVKNGLMQEYKSHISDPISCKLPFELYYSDRYDNLKRQFIKFENLEGIEGYSIGKSKLLEWIDKMKIKYGSEIEQSKKIINKQENKPIDKFINGLLWFGIVFEYRLEK